MYCGSSVVENVRSAVVQPRSSTSPCSMSQACSANDPPSELTGTVWACRRKAANRPRPAAANRASQASRRAQGGVGRACEEDVVSASATSASASDPPIVYSSSARWTSLLLTERSSGSVPANLVQLNGLLAVPGERR